MNIGYDFDAEVRRKWKRYCFLTKIRRIFFNELSFFERCKYILFGKL